MINLEGWSRDMAANNEWGHVVEVKEITNAIKYPFGSTVHSWAKRLAPKQLGKKISGFLYTLFKVFYTKLEEYKGPNVPRKEYAYYYTITETLLADLDWLYKLKTNFTANSTNERFKINIDAEDIRVFKHDLHMLEVDFTANFKRLELANSRTLLYTKKREELELAKIRLEQAIKIIESDPFYKVYYNTKENSKTATINATRMNFATGSLPIMGNNPQKAAAAKKKADRNELVEKVKTTEKAIQQLERNYKRNRSSTNSRTIKGGTRKKKRTPK